jgi:hypothetical protein
MERDYSKDIEINENDLEAEWLEQPSLMLYYSERYAEAIHKRDMRKIRLDYVFADIDSDIRKNWNKHFDSKPTEVALKNYITKDARYRKAEKLHINAVRDVNILAGVKTSFDHRKRALENLVSLRISGFHSEPKRQRQIMDKGGSDNSLTRRPRKRVKSRKSKTSKR